MATRWWPATAVASKPAWPRTYPRCRRPRSSAVTSTTFPGYGSSASNCRPRRRIFTSPITALNAHGAAVVRPSNCHYLNLRGRDRDRHRPRTRAQHLRYADARHYIAGYTDRERLTVCTTFRDTDAGSMLRVKGADTSLSRSDRVSSRIGIITGKSDAHAASMVNRSARTARPTRWRGTCTTSSPTIARSDHVWCRATSSSRAHRPISRPVQPGDVVSASRSKDWARSPITLSKDRLP
jgi:hypothetical protein